MADHGMLSILEELDGGDHAADPRGLSAGVHERVLVRLRRR